MNKSATRWLIYIGVIVGFNVLNYHYHWFSWTLI